MGPLSLLFSIIALTYFCHSTHQNLEASCLFFLLSYLLPVSLPVECQIHKGRDYWLLCSPLYIFPCLDIEGIHSTLTECMNEWMNEWWHSLSRQSKPLGGTQRTSVRDPVSSNPHLSPQPHNLLSPWPFNSSYTLCSSYLKVSYVQFTYLGCFSLS